VTLIRVLIVSDHPAIRAGLAQVIDSEPGLRAEVSGPGSARSALPGADADVVLLDSPLAGHEEFDLCHTMKQLAAPRRVAVYTGRSREEVLLAAWVAGADGLIDKAAPVAALFEQLRVVSRGGRVLASPSARALTEAARDLDAAERVVFGMCVYGVPLEEISRTLRRDPLEVETTVRALIRRLSPPRLPAYPPPGRTPGRDCSPSRAPAHPL
jgi:DNA-binding NarL/FixJ family response regulator